MESQKTLVIGLDALTWDNINKYLRQRENSRIVELADNNASGVSHSTLPPMTPAAWTTIATGVNPAKHGIYDFLQQDRETYRLSSVDYSNMSRPAIWDILNSYGQKIGVVNYPLASPPQEVDPFFISGIPAGTESKIAHPAGLEKRLNSTDYRITPNVKPDNGAEEYLEEIKDLTETQCEITLDLLEEHELDILWSVFMGIDWVQHYLWDETIDGENAVGEFYWYLDSVVGRLVDAVGDDWRILILSDHGAQKIRGEIHMNSLLSDLGYLSKANERGSLINIAKDKLLSLGYSAGQKVPVDIRNIVKETLPSSTLNALRGASNSNQLGMHNNIDWESTRAFSYGYMGRIFIHDSPSYPEGTVSASEYDTVRDKLITDLEALSHPETDTELIDQAIPAEDIYEGAHMDASPDILLKPKNWDYMIYNDFATDWIHEPKGRVADHNPEGVFILSGDEIENKEVDCRLADIAPTLLYLHDLPVLDDMDGKIRKEAIRESERQSREEEYVSAEAIETSNQGQQNGNGDAVQNRLEDLGYL